MRPTVFSADVLRQFLRRKRVATLPQLKQLLGTEADITVFRKLKELSYRTSYSHRGSFYTLDGSPLSMSGVCGRSTRSGSPVTVLWWPPRRISSRSPGLAISPPNWRMFSRWPSKNPCCNWSRKAGSPASQSPAYICTAPAILQPGNSSCGHGKRCRMRPPLRLRASRPAMFPTSFGRRSFCLPACSTNNSGVCTPVWNRSSWVVIARSRNCSVWTPTLLLKGDGSYWPRMWRRIGCGLQVEGASRWKKNACGDRCDPGTDGKGDRRRPDKRTEVDQKNHGKDRLAA